MGVSRRSYAAQRGVSEAAVRKAIATGRITTLPDSTIDSARADSEWGAQTDPAKQRGQQAKEMGTQTGQAQPVRWPTTGWSNKSSSVQPEAARAHGQHSRGGVNSHLPWRLACAAGIAEPDLCGRKDSATRPPISHVIPVAATQRSSSARPLQPYRLADRDQP